MCQSLFVAEVWLGVWIFVWLVAVGGGDEKLRYGLSGDRVNPMGAYLGQRVEYEIAALYHRVGQSEAWCVGDHAFVVDNVYIDRAVGVFAVDAFVYSA